MNFLMWTTLPTFTVESILLLLSKAVIKIYVTAFFLYTASYIVIKKSLIVFNYINFSKHLKI